ncbi:MAG TPA: penicillin acylase family protein [Acidimicrobiales bacterium]|nr:penicillin acylase family protein [Acidimicrobiales bacterium]
MRRSLSALVVAVVLLAGCTSTDDESAPTTSPPTTEADGAGTGGEAPDDARYEATIRRTTDGVPHVRGATYGDVVFGQGWASHEDHACTLAEQVIRVRGERARWLGPGDDDEHIESDMAWRHLGIHELALADWAEATDDITETFEAFAAGWNARHDEVGADGVAGWCAGADWVQPVDPADVYAYSRAITLNASGVALLGLLGRAQPPATDSGTDAGDEDGADEDALAAMAPVVEPALIGSNGWAIGSDRSEQGGGMLVANPHFPWEGNLRFWEVHLTSDDGIDVYGAQLLGLPGVGIGFTSGVAWTHTVSAGKRFTVYRLDLTEGDPTSYRYDGEDRPLEATEVTIEVLQPDGTLAETTRTLWRSHHGPVLDLPGVGWTADTVVAYRDANIDNDEFAAQYRAMNEARSLDDLIAAHATHTGVPLFNTVAVDADGRAWYADTSATPLLSDEALAAWEAAKETDLVVGIAADNGLVLLDGSTSASEWQEVPGARDPGLVPFDAMPQVERRDYLFNANDSFWLPHAEAVLEGDFSPLHGEQRTGRSPRTRQNATVLGDVGPDGPAGPDGRFSLDELAELALDNEGFTARALRGSLVDRCPADGLVDVPERLDGDDVVLPAATVDVSEACAVLAAWDGRHDLDSVGAVLWREVVAQLPRSEAFDAGAIWAEPFDPARPVATPSGLAPASADGTDLAMVWLARAVQLLDVAGVPADVPLGDLQQAPRRDGVRVPIHGGTEAEGVTNKVGWGGSDTMEDTPERGSRLAPWSDLTADGYPINNGTSFVMAVDFGPDGPAARAILTYGNTGDRASPVFARQTERFSAQDWREVAFTEAAIAADPELTEITVRGG